MSDSIKFTGPADVITNLYGEEFKVLQEYIETQLKNASIQCYDGEEFIEFSLVDFRVDKIMEVLLRDKYQAAGWVRVCFARCPDIRFYFPRKLVIV